MRYSYSQQRAIDRYRLDVFRGTAVRTDYDIPVLEPCAELPECGRMVPFNELRAPSPKPISRCGVHFFIDDYQFERVWNDPHKWAWILRDAAFVLTPDFSLYSDMPLCQQIYNVYRNRLIGAYFQKVGARVVPTVSWSDERSYAFCFLGVPKGSVVAVSDNGCLADPESARLWKAGFDRMRKMLDPPKILLYGSGKAADCENENIVYFCNENLRRMRSYGR